MIKGLFCDEVLRVLTSGAYSVSEFGFERRDVAIHLDGGIGAVLKANFFENYTLGDRGTVDAGFMTPFESVPIQLHSVRKAYYSKLPSIPMALEGGLGVYEIFPMEDPSAAFIPMRAGNAGLFKGLAAEHLFGEPGFKQEGMNVWYKNINTAGIQYTAVMMNLICSTINLSMDDDLPLPMDYFNQVRDSVINLMLGVPQKTDSIIDSKK